MNLHPQAEPIPALQLRLIPDLSTIRSPAMQRSTTSRRWDFLSNPTAQRKLFEFLDNSRENATKANLSYGEYPPYNWLETKPTELPLDEVKEYLVLTSFQPQFLAEAKLLDSFSLERNLRDVESPIAYLLPEIQSMRELARLQSLRYRVAIAEKRIDDAIEIIGEQFALARHLGTDEFVVSNLVGAAVASIAWTDLTYVLEMPNAPNLYWALATLPNPIINMQKSLAFERQLVYQQLDPCARSMKHCDRQATGKSLSMRFIRRWPSLWECSRLRA